MQTLFGDLNERPHIEFATDYNLILEKVQHINPVQYAKTRNFITGAVTYLSPYISRGVISIKQVQEAVLKKGTSRMKLKNFCRSLHGVNIINGYGK